MGVLRAALSNFSSGAQQGASTITMQWREIFLVQRKRWLKN
jgi:membrane carboxypeptidase/penicillin-binding protein